MSEELIKRLQAIVDGRLSPLSPDTITLRETVTALTAAQQSIREMEGDAKRRRDQLVGMNLLSEKEVEYWQDALTKVQADGSVVLPPGSNVLCRMAMATAIDSAMDSSSPAVSANT